MELPKEPERGDRITADWARRVARALRALRLTAGPGIRIHAGPDGTTVSAAPAKRAGAEGGAEPVVATVPSIGAAGSVAPLRLYSLDGRELPRSGVRVWAIDLAGETGPLPYSGHVVIAFPTGRLAAAVEETGAGQ